MMPSRKIAGPARACANVRSRRGQARVFAGVARDRTPADKCVCSFGATRVGPMIERVRLHVTTDRFLAGRRGDKMWEAACDYAVLSLARLESKGHETTPPARYTDASLVKRLEDEGIGRPSTYASIIKTILGRGYVFRQGKALIPSFTASRSTAIACSRSRGGPHTPGPASCIAP